MNRDQPRPVNAKTAIAAVIGSPVAHSLSPVLHNAAFAAAGIDAVYVALRVAPSDLAAAVAGFRACGFMGASVTVPHKERIAGLCDALASPADQIGAVNCLVFERRGDELFTVGHNTDAGGFVDSLAREAGVDPAGCRAVILGAGGAARAVGAGLADAGAAHIDVVARTPSRVDWIAARPWAEDTLGELCRGCDLVVDCTSTGLSPDRESEIPAPVPVDLLADDAVVASLVYHRQTELLARAHRRGLRTLHGAGMLVYQGARAFELWTARPAPVDAMWKAMRTALAGSK
ncbi:MAG: shikimate dehydrogenase [Proteobacteria bacterium]|nr:shikimate dehydrogenase [Pseudomonadota bacterium]